MTVLNRRAEHWGWALLLLLVTATQMALLWLAVRHDQTARHGRLEALNAVVAGEFRRVLLQDVERLRDLTTDVPVPERFDASARALLDQHRELLRIELRSPALVLQRSLDSPAWPLLSSGVLPRVQQQNELLAACRTAEDIGTARLSGSYHLGAALGQGVEVVDLCLSIVSDQRVIGFVAATAALPTVLEQILQRRALQDHALALYDPDGSRLTGAGARFDADTPSAARLVEVAGFTVSLEVRQRRTLPWLPEPALVVGAALSLGLLVVLGILWRDVRRRMAAERELAQALALRRAMEDSLVTGLLARDLDGRLTYVNPAFCRMVDHPAEALLGSLHPTCLAPSKPALPPAATATAGSPQEVMLQRRNGEVFPAQLHEAPLLDTQRRHTGWLCTVIDITDQRRADDLLRRQQEKLQSSTRMAMLGEMASLVSHELNQPLTAIAGFAQGSLNMLERPNEPLSPDEERPMLHMALQHIAEQCDRAGRVIKSVHDFVRGRETRREPHRADALIEGILPLVRLQARRSDSQVTVEVDTPAPWVQCDQTMIEQVLLNLSRNGLQAMQATPPPQTGRCLTLRARTLAVGTIEFSVDDQGGGVPAEIAEHLFTPFFSTREGGVGLGLSMCRTAVTQHGGELNFHNLHDAAGQVVGARFHFTLPSARRTPMPPGQRPEDPDHAR